MRKRTLNQTWTLCLRMWKWVSKKWKEGNTDDVWDLKYVWLEENGFQKHGLGGACFFCDYAEDRCIQCPGQLIDSDFSCINENYDYEDKPVEFYKELLRLNRIRKAKK